MVGILHDKVGFDYPKAILDLRERFTYDELAEIVGYESKASIADLVKGRMPGHIHGEAIWALYCDTFGRKPPLIVRNSEPLSTA